MARYIVPPRKKSDEVIVKCCYCGTLYVPEHKVKHGYGMEIRENFFESCPTCGCSVNWKTDTIPLWKYNLIRYWRGLFDRNSANETKGDENE